MKYFNAAQAAKRIGISDKTIRRWLKEGKISAIRTPSNQLAIPESEVEKYRRQRAQFVQEDTTSPDQIDTLAAKVAQLEQEIATLKQGHTDVIEQVIEQPISTPEGDNTSHSKKRAYTRSEGIPADLPQGTIKTVDFVEKYALPESSFSRWVKEGLKGERIDTETRQKASGMGVQHFLTPAQQEKALDLLRRHGKLKTQEMA